MTKHICEAGVLQQTQLASDVNMLKFQAPAIAQDAQPGQFLTIEVTKQAAPFLRRPFGIADVDRQQGIVTVVYRIVGDGTKILAQVKPGDTLNVIGPLGHGFSMTAQHPLIVGGGMGLAPLHFLAKSYPPKNVEVLMGAKTVGELFWTKLFQDKIQKLYITTDDGSAGTKGTVNALLPNLLGTGKYDCVYLCGSSPMMRGVIGTIDASGVPCQISLEKYMACGLGACLSCSCSGIGKRMKVCTDGPVFWSKEVVEW